MAMDLILIALFSFLAGLLDQALLKKYNKNYGFYIGLVVGIFSTLTVLF
jgi:uncharacterized membrane protein YeaQ/YmgE (transglycosylase-associated protein family)